MTDDMLEVIDGIDQSVGKIMGSLDKSAKGEFHLLDSDKPDIRMKAGTVTFVVNRPPEYDSRTDERDFFRALPAQAHDAKFVGIRQGKSGDILIFDPQESPISAESKKKYEVKYSEVKLAQIAQSVSAEDLESLADCLRSLAEEHDKKVARNKRAENYGDDYGQFG